MLIEDDDSSEEELMNETLGVELDEMGYETRLGR